MQLHLSPAAVILVPLPDYCHDSIINLIVRPRADTCLKSRKFKESKRYKIRTATMRSTSSGYSIFSLASISAMSPGSPSACSSSCPLNTREAISEKLRVLLGSGRYLQYPLAAPAPAPVDKRRIPPEVLASATTEASAASSTSLSGSSSSCSLHFRNIRRRRKGKFCIGLSQGQHYHAHMLTAR